MSATDALKQADKFYELKELPNAKTLMMKAAGTSSKKATPETTALRLGARVHNVHIDREWVRAYNEVCGFEGLDIGLTAPQVLASPLHMYLMSRKEHPFPMLGMVHLHNSITLHKPLEFEKPYDVVVLIGDTRTIPQGLEFDVLTQIFDGEALAWEGTMSILSRVKGIPKPASKPAPPEPLDVTSAKYIPLKVPENQGRKYAKVSNDYNPIHLHATTAKMFGFKQAIAHGMWTAAKTLSLLEPQLGAPAKQFDLSFKQPVFLPSASSLKYVAKGKKAEFELLSDRGSKVQISGVVKA